MLWDFCEKVEGFRDSRNKEGLDEFFFRKVLATKVPSVIKERGLQYEAVNVLKLIDRDDKAKLKLSRHL